MDDIAYQNKDIASKVMGDTLIGKSLGPFGLPHLQVIDVLPTNLPVIESNELRLDHLFLLNDGSLAIIDYESKYDKENFVKYLNYIARVVKRYVVQNHLEQLKEIKMVVIYTADVEQAEDVYDLGGVVLKVEVSFLVKQDFNVIYRHLERKISSGQRLTEEELMQLMILPLTVKGNEEKQHLTIKTVGLIRRIQDKNAAVRVLAGVLTFTDKVITEEYKNQIKEEFHMTQIGQMLIEEGIEKGERKKAYSSAHNMYKRGFSAEEAAEILEESVTVVASWYEEWD